MSITTRHPACGATIIHVIPSAWGPFVDIRVCYESLARRRPWTHVIDTDRFWTIVQNREPWWLDPSVVFVCWEMLDPGPRYQRSCKVVHVFAEAMDENLDRMLPDHVAHWLRFKDRVVHYDAVLTHTPWTTDFVRKHTQADLVFTMPVGWDAAAMGAPRWHAPKHHLIGYHGSRVGRRQVFVPYFAERWHDMTGSFGRGLLAQLDVTAISLYIAHSLVASFSTWRMWQVASTSAVMVIEGDEPPDVWPFTENCYVRVPRLTAENLSDVFHRTIINIAEVAAAGARDAALNAHEVARTVTVDHVEDTYLVPAIERMMR